MTIGPAILPLGKTGIVHRTLPALNKEITEALSSTTVTAEALTSTTKPAKGKDPF